jgi:ATP synthase in type III secretion protein N
MSSSEPTVQHGGITSVLGAVLRARGVDASIGELCLLHDHNRATPLLAEIVGFANGEHILAPLEDPTGLSEFTRVVALHRCHSVLVGSETLGKVLDGLGRPLDGAYSDSSGCISLPVNQTPPAALDRPPIHRTLATGVRAIDGFMTCGEGQRLGIFAPAGCGKTTLLGQIARNADYDVLVIALIGERGRELKEFLERQLDPATRARCVVIVATSDRAAIERARAGDVATTIASHFASEGNRVLLMFDSLTRYARALREIGLAAGEPAVRRGFPPSVFSNLPKLVERTGPMPVGSVTAFYTVLEEDTSGSDPIAEEVRSLLDGHIVLSRKLADAGHFPAIDVLASISRLMSEIVDTQHRQSASHARGLLDKYQSIELLVQVGEYRPGSDAVGDEALEKKDRIDAFLKQDVRDKTALISSVNALNELCENS